MLQKMQAKLYNRKGFTLIELIVVIAIIAILAAVLIPRFTGFTQDAREKAAISEARNVLLAVDALMASGEAVGDIDSAAVEGYGVSVGGTMSAVTAAADGSPSFTYTSADGYTVTITAGEVIQTSVATPT